MSALSSYLNRGISKPNHRRPFSCPRLASTGCLIALLSCLPPVSQAAVVTWSYAELAIDGSNVATDGVIHTSVAYGAGETGVRVINGVNWNVLTPGAHTNPDWDPGGGFIDNRNVSSTYYGTSGDESIKDTTDDIVFNASLTTGISNLTVGLEYRIQIISFDAAVGGLSVSADILERRQTITSSGNTGSLDFNQFIAGDGSDPLHFRAALVTGTWIADSTDFSFTMAKRGDNDNAILNAFVVQAIPEPSTFTMLAGALALLVAWCVKGRRTL